MSINIWNLMYRLGNTDRIVGDSENPQTRKIAIAGAKTIADSNGWEVWVEHHETGARIFESVKGAPTTQSMTSNLGSAYTQPQTSDVESDTDIALRICNGTGSIRARVFSDGDIQLFATAKQFDTLVRELVAHRVKRILDALDGMDLGCTEPGFQGHQNGLGDESAGNELQAAREELIALVESVKSNAEILHPLESE